jgi:hypothetical protein
VLQSAKARRQAQPAMAVTTSVKKHNGSEILSPSQIFCHTDRELSGTKIKAPGVGVVNLIYKGQTIVNEGAVGVPFPEMETKGLLSQRLGAVYMSRQAWCLLVLTAPNPRLSIASFYFEIYSEIINHN